MIFLFEEKIMARSRDIYIFVFFWSLQISKSVTSSQTLLHNGSYTFVYFFGILSTIKTKFGQILVYLIKNISNLFLAQSWDWKLVSGYFIILMKWWYNEICQFLVVDIYHFQFSLMYSPFQKNETLESGHNWFLSNWSRLLNCKGPGT